MRAKKDLKSEGGKLHVKTIITSVMNERATQSETMVMLAK